MDKVILAGVFGGPIDPKSGQTGLRCLDKVRDKINGRILKSDGIGEYTLDANATG